MQAVAASQQVARARPGARDAFQRIVGQQAEQIEQQRPRRQAELLERAGATRLHVVDVELQDARERGALHELLRTRADTILGVHEDLAVVDVESQQRHAGE